MIRIAHQHGIRSPSLTSPKIVVNMAIESTFEWMAQFSSFTWFNTSVDLEVHTWAEGPIPHMIGNKEPIYTDRLSGGCESQLYGLALWTVKIPSIWLYSPKSRNVNQCGSTFWRVRRSINLVLYIWKVDKTCDIHSTLFYGLHDFFHTSFLDSIWYLLTGQHLTYGNSF